MRRENARRCPRRQTCWGRPDIWPPGARWQGTASSGARCWERAWRAGSSGHPALGFGFDFDELAGSVEGVPDVGFDAVLAHLTGANVDQVSVVLVAVAEDNGVASGSAGTAPDAKRGRYGFSAFHLGRRPVTRIRRHRPVTRIRRRRPVPRIRRRRVVTRIRRRRPATRIRRHRPVTRIR
ncbi:MAG TPA: hypothetical protein ACQGQI_07870, partial [Xylella sp.]